MEEDGVAGEKLLEDFVLELGGGLDGMDCADRANAAEEELPEVDNEEETELEEPKFGL